MGSGPATGTDIVHSCDANNFRGLELRRLGWAFYSIEFVCNGKSLVPSCVTIRSVAVWYFSTRHPQRSTINGGGPGLTPTDRAVTDRVVRVV